MAPSEGQGGKGQGVSASKTPEALSLAKGGDVCYTNVEGR